MKYLAQGLESDERLSLLISLTNIRSDSIKFALNDFLVKGINYHLSAALHDVPEPNLARALTRLETVAATIEKIKDIDWNHLNH